MWSFHGGIFYHGIRRCAFGASTDHDLSDQLIEVLIDGLIDAAPRAFPLFAIVYKGKLTEPLDCDWRSGYRELLCASHCLPVQSESFANGVTSPPLFRRGC